MAEKLSTATSSGAGEPVVTAIPGAPTGSAPDAGDGSRSGSDSGPTGGRSSSVERVLGLAANVAGIVGALVSLRSGQLVWLLPSFAVAAYLLYAVWHRHWTAAGASLLVFVVLAGAGYITTADSRVPKPSPSATWMAGGGSTLAATVPAGPPSTVGPADPAPSPGAGAPPQVMEITLPRHAAVDVDRAGQPVVLNQAGVTGAFDLYHDAGEVKSDSILTPDGLFSYPVGTGVDAAYPLCRGYLSDPQTAGRQDGKGLYLDSAFCFRTSDGRVAWAKIVAVQSLDDTAVLSVRVWSPTT